MDNKKRETLPIIYRGYQRVFSLYIKDALENSVEIYRQKSNLFLDIG